MLWNILTTFPGRERSSAAALAARGVLAFCPLVRLSRRKVTAMFPGYLFGVLDKLGRAALPELAPLRELVLDEVPATLTLAAIEAIRAQAEELAEHWQQPFRPGDRVAITADAGPWEGVEGLVQRLDGADKIQIEACLPGRQMRLTLPARWLEPAESWPLMRRRAGA